MIRIMPLATTNTAVAFAFSFTFSFFTFALVGFGSCFTCGFFPGSVTVVLLPVSVFFPRRFFPVNAFLAFALPLPLPNLRRLPLPLPFRRLPFPFPFP